MRVKIGGVHLHLIPWSVERVMGEEKQNNTKLLYKNWQGFPILWSNQWPQNRPGTFKVYDRQTVKKYAIIGICF